MYGSKFPTAVILSHNWINSQKLKYMLRLEWYSTIVGIIFSHSANMLLLCLRFGQYNLTNLTIFLGPQSSNINYKETYRHKTNFVFIFVYSSTTSSNYHSQQISSNKNKIQPTCTSLIYPQHLKRQISKIFYLNMAKSFPLAYYATSKGNQKVMHKNSINDSKIIMSKYCKLMCHL